MYYVYVIQDIEDEAKFYTGFSSNLRKRLEAHNAGINKSTHSRQWRLVYYEAYLTEQPARDRERILKHDGRVKRFLMDRIRKHL